MPKKIEGQGWPEEPWSDGFSGAGCKEFFKSWKARDRARTCVNACAGIPNPAAVGEVIEAAQREQLDCYCPNDKPEDCPCDWCVMDRALAALDKDPDNA